MAAKWASSGALTKKALAEKPSSSGNAPKLPQEFWLKKGEEVTAILLDEAVSFSTYRHSKYNPANPKSAGVKVPCLAGASAELAPKKCPMCRAQLRDEAINRNFVAYITIIDVEGYEYQGERRRNVKRLVALPNKVAETLVSLYEKSGSLRGREILIRRTSEAKSPAVGDIWAVTGEKYNLVAYMKEAKNQKCWRKFHEFRVKNPANSNLELKQSFQDYITPYDYEDILEPTPERINYFLTMAGHDPEAYGSPASSGDVASGDYVAKDGGEKDDIDKAFDDLDGFGDPTITVEDSSSDDYLSDGDLSEPYDEDDLPFDVDEAVDAEEQSKPPVKKAKKKATKKTTKKAATKDDDPPEKGVAPF